MLVVSYNLFKQSSMMFIRLLIYTMLHYVILHYSSKYVCIWLEKSVTLKKCHNKMQNFQDLQDIIYYVLFWFSFFFFLFDYFKSKVLISSITVRSVQFSRSVMSNYLQHPWTAACQASLSITNSQNYSDSCPSSQ